MQKRALSLVLCLAVFFAVSTEALAAESAVNLMVEEVTQETSIAATEETQEVAATIETEVAETAEEDAPTEAQSANIINLVIDGISYEDTIVAQVENDVTYIAYGTILKALYPDAVATWEDDHALCVGTDLELSIYPAEQYLEINGRYLWVADGMKISNGLILVPIRSLCEALSASIYWDAATNEIHITSNGNPLVSGDLYYQEDVIYWLSRIINAESGNQSLEGKIAVGNVILNRVESSRFPSTVYDVIFEKNQFTPASNGSIYKDPNEESILAAKLCLDGANTAEDCYFFVNPTVSPNSWAARNCTYVQTIGAHAFFS